LTLLDFNHQGNEYEKEERKKRESNQKLGKKKEGSQNNYILISNCYFSGG